VLVSLLANLKSYPLIGYKIASPSWIVLILSWLVLCGISLFARKQDQPENRSQPPAG
jgi:hypothetical protein